MTKKRILAIALALLLALTALTALAESGWTWNTSTDDTSDTLPDLSLDGEAEVEENSEGEQTIQQFVRANQKLTVRANPSVNGESMGTMNVNEQVPFLGEVYVDEKTVVWYQVQFYIYGDGWISSLDGFLTTETEVAAAAAAPETKVEEDSYVYGYTGNSYLRSGPGLNYPSLAMVLYRGQSALYLNQSSVDSRGIAWYNINLNGKTGWVSSRYTLLTSNVPTGNFISAPATYSAPKTTGSYVRATASVNVRTGPGLGYADMGTLSKGEQVVYLGNTSVDDRGVLWYQVTYKSKGTGWVSSVYSTLSNSGSVGAPSTGSSGGSGSHVKATGGKSNLRSGPGLDYSDVGTLQNGDTAEYLGQQSTDERGVVWYKVKHNGKTCWVSSKYTSLTNGGSSSSSSSSSSSKKSGSTVKATGGKSNLRSGPGLDYKDIGTMQKGDTATFLGEKSTDDRGVVWYKVSFNGKTGWVSSKYTTLS